MIIRLSKWVLSHISEWVFGSLAIVLGLAGLILASRAADPVAYLAGLLMFGFAVLFNFWLIKRAFDKTA